MFSKSFKIIFPVLKCHAICFSLPWCLLKIQPLILYVYFWRYCFFLYLWISVFWTSLTRYGFHFMYLAWVFAELLKCKKAEVLFALRILVHFAIFTFKVPQILKCSVVIHIFFCNAYVNNHPWKMLAILFWLNFGLIIWNKLEAQLHYLWWLSQLWFNKNMAINHILARNDVCMASIK